MKYLAAVSILAFFTALASAQSATEKVEKRLADLLSLKNATSVAEPPAAMTHWKASRAVEEIGVPIAPPAAAPARLGLAPLKEARPRSSPEAKPLVHLREDPSVPELVQLPTKPLIKLPSVDAKTPAPIPILAKPVQDRASLGEPAFEASLAATMRRVEVLRDRPVPFVPLNLPDPFEHFRHGQLRNAPAENPTLPVIPLVKPR